MPSITESANPTTTVNIYADIYKNPWMAASFVSCFCIDRRSAKSMLSCLDSSSITSSVVNSKLLDSVAVAVVAAAVVVDDYLVAVASEERRDLRTNR